MKHVITGLALAASLLLLSPGQGLAQSTPDEASVQAVAAPVAYFYMQTSKGVYAYTASSAGKIAPINSTPYPVVGGIQHASGKYLISQNKTWLYAYPIESNGALGKQADSINTLSYGGSQCGDKYGQGSGSTFERTGKYFYVSLFSPTGNEGDGCAVMQSYQVESNGQFKYLGYVEADGNPQGLGAVPDSVPVFSSNDKFAYALYPNFEDGHYTSFTGFKIASNGDLQAMSFAEKDPQTPGDAWFYNPIAMAADNAGHLAVVLNWFAGYPPPRLASYTIDGSGNLKSTNTAADMPSLAESGAGMTFSPSGKLLAVPEATGVHLFNFNGAAPITANKRIAIPGGVTGSLAWDNHNHLYAQGTAGLYVYTVTPTSVAEVPGSPFKVAASSWIVVPKP